MARRRKNTLNMKFIEAFLYTPLIVLGPTKRDRRSARRKWLSFLCMLQNTNAQKDPTE